MKRFDRLPQQLQTQISREYYRLLCRKRITLFIKALSDRLIALVAFILLLPLLLVIAVCVKCGSRGPVLYCQRRVGRYLVPFDIIKFRTMVTYASSLGGQLTVGERDPRITRIGGFLRRYRLDELPQLINVIKGDMSFVGSRPEVPKYVACYTDEMRCTLLLRPGITGLASIEYKDENALLGQQENPEQCYIEQVLPIKMGLDLKYVRELSLLGDIKLMLRTVAAVLK